LRKHLIVGSIVVMKSMLLGLSVAATWLAACDLGIAPGTTNNTVDGSTNVDGSVGTDGSSALCESPSLAKPDGHHNPGQNCMVSGCHGGGGGGPVFTTAGTLYTTQGGNTPAAGATVFVGNQKLITASNGNFFIGAAITFPTTTKVSLCPDTKPMVGALQNAAAGNCNSCHNGATTAKLFLK
jgi:hypothetical protein